MKKELDILVVDDERVVIEAVVKICSSENYSVDYAMDAKEALLKTEKNIYSIIICDIMMPGLDGFELLNEFHTRKITSSVIMTTGYSTVENAVKSLYSGAIDFIPKPFTANELINSVLRGMRYRKIQKLLTTNSASIGSDDPGIIYVPCPAKYYRLGYSSWAAEENTGSVLIGATDLFIKTLDNISEVELLSVDEEVVQGNFCATILESVSINEEGIKEERRHPLLSPVSGKILEVNEEIIKNKNLIEKDPYFEGWFYRLIPSDSEYELKNLIHCSSDRI